MGSDKVFKKSFLGGFKKEGVLNYVEQLQSEIVALKKEVSNNTAVCDEVEALKAAKDNVISESASLAAKYDALKAENESLSEKNLQLMQELDDAKNKISDYENKQSVFESKINSIENKFAALANGYMLNSGADSEIFSRTTQAIETAKSEVSDVNERIKTVCNNFESSAVALKSSVENLLKTLNSISEEIADCEDKD